MSFKDRLGEILDEKKINQREFERITGYSHVSLSNVLIGKTQLPKIDLLLAIAEALPEVDIHWLVTGKGSRYRSDEAILRDQLAEEPTEQYASDPRTLALAETQAKLIRMLEERQRMMEEKIRKEDPDLARELGIDEE